MDLWQGVVLGVVEGLTEFLPVSSTAHLTIAEQLLGLRVDDAGVTAFTAIVQLGAIAAVLVSDEGTQVLHGHVAAVGAQAASLDDLAPGHVEGALRLGA